MNKNSKQFFFTKYFTFLGKRSYVLIIALLLIILGVYLNLRVPLYIKKILDLVNTGNMGTYQIVLNLVYQLVFLKFIIWVITRSKEYIMTLFLVKSNSILRNKAFEYTINHSSNFFANSFAGSLAKKINDYASSFQSILFQLESVILPLFVQIIGSSIIIFSINKKIGLFFIFGFLFIALYNIIFAIIKMKYDKPASESMSKIVGFTADSLSGNSAISLFAAHQYELSLREEKEKLWRKSKLQQWLFGDTVFSVQGLLFLFLEYFILKYSIIGWHNGLVTGGEFVMFQFYVIGSFAYMNSLAFSIRMIYESYADAQEMIEILETPHEIKDKKDAKMLVIKDGSIDFKQVTFLYNKNSEALSALSLHIPHGQKVGIVGPSGAGKSTFVKLLLRLFDVTSGSILIDGQDIREVTQESLHDNIGFVPQDPALFHRSLMENIRYGKRDATDEEVYEAARKAHAHEFISKLSDGYNTLVGERGVKLSGGERQRIAIARAILKNAPILVLDEATSALDSYSERLIQDGFDTLMKNKTVIVIAHRLSTISHLDRIVVIDGGKIIEDGTHEELLNHNDSVYKKLWNLQAGGFIK